MIFGVELSVIYLTGLIIAGSLTLINALFGDLLDALFESVPGAFINPTVVLSFVAVLCGAGFVFENGTQLSSLTGLFISVVIALVLVTLLHMLVLAPLSKAESSVGYHMSDLIGDYGTVTTSIGKENDYGEVIVKTTFSIKGYPARSVSGLPVASGEEVQIVDIDKENQVLIVSVEEKKLMMEEKTHE
ncbi:NfeD family protein [Alteribacter keqinensis]|uniref:Membrane protein NfeD2 N-terminal transmembrane domain-containing protein n=1 Tax=Alteribacter keqinensis TaxID=2483800 RepID=A0A3M7TV27_9BACI|nr:NfeD family protein [Alteribacter keqinensis]RNA69486.1 hypothetical protein EBO34_06000 [Alteribacter keqinensis]